MRANCPYGEYPERPHNFFPLIYDVPARNETVQYICCSLCGETREIGPTTFFNEDSAEYAAQVRTRRRPMRKRL